ncbi:MAG: TolC family protein [Acidobacteriota bacterium]|jgi:outer membrane protein TolC
MPILTAFLLLASLQAAAPSAGDEGLPPLRAYDFAAPDPQLAAWIDRLLGANPELRASRAADRAAAAAVDGASALPDLQLRYGYFASSPETRVGPQIQSLEVSQSIPWKGKRRSALETAVLESSDAAWQVRARGRALVAELKGVFFETVYVQEAIRINAEERELLARFESIALKRYATGEGIQQNVLRVQTDITRLEDRHADLHDRFFRGLRRIAQLIGSPEEELWLDPVSLPLPPVQFAGRELEDQAVAAHPAVRSTRARVQAGRTRERTRLLDGRPDWRFGVAWTQVDPRQDTAGQLLPPEDNGQDVLALTVGLSLPVYRKRIHAGVAEAREDVLAEEQRLRSQEDGLRRAVQQAELRLDSLHERSRLYEEVLIPQARESLASAEAAYTTNRLDFLDLLDAERVLFEARLTRQRLLVDYWIALTDMEHAIASPFPPQEVPGR